MIEFFAMGHASGQVADFGGVLAQVAVGNTYLEDVILEAGMSTTVTSKGQVTIPKLVRDRLGIKPGSAVSFELNAQGGVMLVHEGINPTVRSFSRLRGVAGDGMSTNEILALTRGDG